MKNESRRLVKKAIKGNKSAFEKLVQQHYERIYRTAYLYVHNEEDALDVVQEIGERQRKRRFLQVWRRLLLFLESPSPQDLLILQ